MEVFHTLLMYRKHFKKYPNMNEMDALKGELVQPISLNIVSNKLVWHIPLANHSIGKLISAFIDQSLYKDCNNYMFEDPNPEKQFRNQQND